MTRAGDTGADGIEVRPAEDAEIANFVDVFDSAWGFGSGNEQRQHTSSVVAGLAVGLLAGPRRVTGVPSNWSTWRRRGSCSPSFMRKPANAAYRSLWAYLTDQDLTEWVVAAGRPEHEPLRWALADSRQFVVTAVDDHLWLRLVDLAVALSGRRYATEGSLVLDVADEFCPWNEGRWLLEGGPDGGECRRSRGQGRASLRLDSSVLGSLFLGGASVLRLAKVGRISADLMSLRCAHQMFGADLDPWCSTEF